MPNLYELMGDYAAIQDAIDSGAEDEEIERLIQAMDEAKGTLKEKVDNVCRVLRNIDAQATSVKNEKDRLAKREKSLKNNKERLRDWVRTSMDLLDVSSIKTDLNSVSLTPAKPTVVVVEEKLVPEEYVTVETTIKVDKKAVLRAYEDDGEIVQGCDIVPGKASLTIR